MISLVTGGAGFVGSHLCERLLKEGHEVYSLDNYFTGSESNHIQGVHYFKGETAEISNIMPDEKYDFVFHLGEFSRVERSFDDIDLVFKYNWNSIYAILKFTKDNKSKLIYSGSSTKFGDSGKNKFESPYSFTKYSNSMLVKSYAEWNDLNYAITYFYNVYGEREIESGAYATVVAKFLRQKRSGSQKLQVVSPGTQTRNFTHVSDIINGLILVGEKGFGDDYGIGSDESCSIIELANLFDLPFELVPANKGNRLSSELKNVKVKDLGWNPKVKLKDYILQCLNKGIE